jgi:hypothetical protein
MTGCQRVVPLAWRGVEVRGHDGLKYRIGNTAINCVVARLQYSLRLGVESNIVLAMLKLASWCVSAILKWSTSTQGTTASKEGSQSCFSLTGRSICPGVEKSQLLFCQINTRYSLLHLVLEAGTWPCDDWKWNPWRLHPQHAGIAK